MKFPFFIGLLFCSMTLLSQTKYEQETKRAAASIPSEASSWLSSLAPKKKIRWYQESSQQGVTIEAKTGKYSIEFDSTGRLLDVEKTVAFRRMPKQERSIIATALAKEWGNYRIQKAQYQWIGNSFSSSPLPFGASDDWPPFDAFEIVIAIKKTKKRVLVEVLLDKEGKLLRKWEIISPPNLHLSY